MSPYTDFDHGICRAANPFACSPRPIEREGDPTDFSFPPKYGEHTRSILAEVGYEAGEIDRLVDSGAAGVPQG